MIGEKNRTLIVELLRDDCDLILTKYLHHSDYGIEGSEACVVQIDASGRHALVHQRVFHVGGLIIPLHVVVAADDEIVDFPVVVEFRRRRLIWRFDMNMSQTAFAFELAQTRRWGTSDTSE